MGSIGSLLAIMPFTLPAAFVSRGLWTRGPNGDARGAPTYPAGRVVFVELPAVIADFRSPYFGWLWAGPEASSTLAVRRFFTYRASIASTQASPDMCTLSVPTLNARGDRSVTQIDVPWRAVLDWNNATNFPLLTTKTTTTIFDDAIQGRYADFVTRVKLNECALALADIVDNMDFAAAIAERQTTGGGGGGSAVANQRLLLQQIQCVRRIRGCMDMIHHVQQGKDPNRLCVPDCGRLSTYGQWHCHGMASVMASLLLPFSAALGIDVRLIDGFWFHEGLLTPEWDGVPFRSADHTWLELTFFPSAVSVVCDPSFDRFEGEVVPLDKAYSPAGNRFPSRRFTARVGQLLLAKGIPECDDCAPPHTSTLHPSLGAQMFPLLPQSLTLA
jgi:hypothetical protein